MAKSFTPPSPVLVAPNISGDVFYGDYAFKVNTNNGTIIYNQARPPVKLKATPPPAPAAPLNFFDRAAESAQLDLIINTHSRLTVVGPEGVGKSTLLRQVANSDTAQKLPHGVVLADGADAEGTRLSINDVIQQLFDQLYDSEPYLKVTAVTARVHLAQTQPLVLIDNVRFPSPDSLRTLIDLFPKSPILLAMPYSPGGNLTRLVDLGPLPRTDAVQLFAATLNQPTGKLNRATINAICATLNNVPLAITTVADAVRTNNLPVDDVLATLNQIKPASSDPIQAGLERAYGLVYSTLSPLERQVLAIAASLPAKSIDPEMIQRMVTGELATLPGGEIKREGKEVNIGGVRVPIRDAANVPDKDDTQPTTINRVSAAIDKLKGMGLLRSNSPRLRIAAGLRLIAQIDVDQDAIHNQLVFQLLNDVRLNKHLNWQYCADELGNILGAIEWAVRQKRWTDVILLGRAIDPYLTLHGLWDAWRSVLDQILQAAHSNGDRSTEAWALHQIGTQTIGSDNKTQAIDFFRQALSLRQALGDTIGAAYTQHNLDVLIVPPPIDRGREKPDSQPPRSGVGTGLKAIIGAAIVITAAAIILPRVINPAPTPAVTSAPIRVLTVHGSFQTTEFDRATGNWNGIVTVSAEGGQAPYAIAGNWSSTTEQEVKIFYLNENSCQSATLLVHVGSADGQYAELSDNQFRPAECDNFVPIIVPEPAKVLKIISSFPLLGPASSVTEPIVKLIQLKLKQINYQACDGNYELVYESLDDASAASGTWDSITELKNANRAVADPAVIAYIGTYNSGAAKISIPILNKAGLVMISPANTYPGLTKPGLGIRGEPDIFYPSGQRTYARVIPTDEVQGKAAANWAKSMEVSSVYILDDGQLYGKSVADAFYAEAKALRINILGQQSVDPKTADYKALMTKLAAMNDSFPAMMIYAGISDPSNAALLLKYKIEYMGDNFKVKWMGLDSLQDQAFIDAAGANQAEGAYATFNRLLKAELPPDGQAFLEEYARKYGPIASSLAPYGYESVSVVINAIENICNAGGDASNRAAVRAEVMATQDFSGVLGTWSFDKYGDTTLSDMTGFVVKQGEYVPVDGINANH